MPKFKPQIIVFNINDADSSLFQKSLFTNFSPLFEGRSGKKTELQTVVENVLSASFMPILAFFSPNSKIAPFSKAACMSKKEDRRQQDS